tara:strand:- start:1281 stop:2810 length:1530 start_codon:yes stop_codon:yes gene_type:complete
MAKPSFANIVCTTSSANTAIGTTAAPVFDTNHGSVVFSNNISDDITWDQTAGEGTFTFARDGIYHVVLSLFSVNNAANRDTTVTFTKNSDSAFYTGVHQVLAAMDPAEGTHQKILSISAGDVLNIEALAEAGTIGITKGTSLSITEITSGVYISNTVTTNASTSTTDEFNPYDTDLSGGPVFAAGNQIASAITFTGDAGSWTIAEDGKYFIMVSNFMGSAGATNSNVTIHLKSGDDEIFTGAYRASRVAEPVEATFCVVEDLATGAVLTITWDIGSGQAQANIGSTITLYKIDDTELVRGAPSFISVLNKAVLTATASEINPFDEDSYSSASFDTRSNGGFIAFDASDGTFTISEAGPYFIIHNQITQAASDAIVTSEVKINDVVKLTFERHIDSNPDPQNTTVHGILDCAVGDVIIVTIDSDSPNIGHDAGSTLTILKLRDGWVFREAVPESYITDNFTLNTFSQDFLSSRHKRDAAQVPFLLGVPGPLSLRGRTSQVAVVSKGDKKN